jgi:energy-coupling factor transport system ATP-binding protein
VEPKLVSISVAYCAQFGDSRCGRGIALLRSRADTAAMIEIGDVTFTYPGEAQPSIEALNFNAGPGLHLLVGPSGGGKSTFLRLCNGLVPHATGGTISGSIRVNGRDVLSCSVRELARDVGYLFQDPELQAIGNTVERDVAFGPGNLGCTYTQITERVANALDLCGIEHLRYRKLSELSGGERHLVALAGVIAMQTPIVCLDEPLVQLDDANREAVTSVCKQLADSGTTVVISEHRINDLARIADSITEIGTRELVGRSGKDRAVHREGAQTWSMTNLSIGLNGQVVAKDLSARGYAGQTLVISGANGCGKTTLLRTIAEFLPPLQGTLQVDAPSRAYLPQNPSALLWRPTVRAEIDATIAHRGRGDPIETTRMFGLEGVADRYPADLSTGERQRAALAAVLAGDPELVLLDEPTRGMDPRAFSQLVSSINNLTKNGSSVVLATHDRDLIDAVGDQTFAMSGEAEPAQQKVEALV